jgi:hypothetical protein
VFHSASSGYGIGATFANLSQTDRYIGRCRVICIKLSGFSFPDFNSLGFMSQPTHQVTKVRTRHSLGYLP